MPIGPGDRTPLAGAFLVELAAIEWASRMLPRGIVHVRLEEREAFVAVEEWGGEQEEFGPLAYTADCEDLVEGLVRPARLEVPRGPLPVPSPPDPERPWWRHVWAELLLDLGQYAYALREADPDSTLRYAGVHLNEHRVATIDVVDELGRRWVSVLPIDPPAAEVATVSWDIRWWINNGLGDAVDVETTTYRLQD